MPLKLRPYGAIQMCILLLLLLLLFSNAVQHCKWCYTKLLEGAQGPDFSQGGRGPLAPSKLPLPFSMPISVCIDSLLRLFFLYVAADKCNTIQVKRSNPLNVIQIKSLLSSIFKPTSKSLAVEFQSKSPKIGLESNLRPSPGLESYNSGGRTVHLSSSTCSWLWVNIVKLQPQNVVLYAVANVP